MLALIAYMGIMHFSFEGEAAVAILPYLALAIATTVYSSLKDPFLVLGTRARRLGFESRHWAPSERSSWSSSSSGFPAPSQSV
eukprot:5828595-Pleurochrysis_carterae.AAC.1